LSAKSYESPVVLVTGGSRGIGAACVRAFQNEGWQVSTIALAQDEVHPANCGRVLRISGDVTEAHVREGAVEETLRVFGRIDALINNAGVGLYAPATEVSRELFLRLLDVNVFAPLAMAQLVLPAMRRQGSGTIVNVGSVAGEVALPWTAAYCASKAALHSIHDSLRRQLRGTPVRLMKVAPGIVDTDFRAHVLGGAPPDSVRQIRRVVPADAVADAILRGVYKGRRTVYVPKIGAIFTLLGSIAPSLMDLYLSLLTRRDGSEQQRPAVALDSNNVQPGETLT
jgi:NAD(P)-dependent dehydrogenase (short-subunit alcohol dehydrogenase family)